MNLLNVVITWSVSEIAGVIVGVLIGIALLIAHISDKISDLKKRRKQKTPHASKGLPNQKQM